MGPVIVSPNLLFVSATSWTESVAVLDAVGLFAVGLLVVLGMARGLWWQVIRLLGVTVAVIFARTWDQALGAELAARWTELSPRLADGLAWLLLFLAGMSLATLLGRFGAGLLEAMKLGLLNRAAGALLGAVTGVLLHLTLLVALCQLAPESFLTNHVSGTWSERLVHALAVERSVVLGATSGANLQDTMGRADRARPEPEAPPDGETVPGPGETPAVEAPEGDVPPAPLDDSAEDEPLDEMRVR